VEARGIHHFGVAVEDLDEAVATYARLFGAELEHRREVADQGVEAAALLVGNGRVELLASLTSPTRSRTWRRRSSTSQHGERS
jgi:methylmalonyl-CoA/ethylmalonyl-CoA epimerase